MSWADFRRSTSRVGNVPTTLELNDLLSNAIKLHNPDVSSNSLQRQVISMVSRTNKVFQSTVSPMPIYRVDKADIGMKALPEIDRLSEQLQLFWASNPDHALLWSASVPISNPHSIILRSCFHSQEYVLDGKTFVIAHS